MGTGLKGTLYPPEVYTVLRFSHVDWKDYVRAVQEGTETVPVFISPVEPDGYVLYKRHP